MNLLPVVALALTGLAPAQPQAPPPSPAADAATAPIAAPDAA